LKKYVRAGGCGVSILNILQFIVVFAGEINLILCIDNEIEGEGRGLKKTRV